MFKLPLFGFYLVNTEGRKMLFNILNKYSIL